MSDRFKRYLKTFLKFGLTATALYFVFRKIELSDILALYKQSKIEFLIIALILFVISKTLSAFRLNIFFKNAGLEIPNVMNLKLYLLGMFYNLFLPGGIGGDGYKIYWLQKKYKSGTGKLFGAVLTDRLSGMAALGVLAAVIFTLINIPFAYNIYGFLLIPLIFAGLYFFMRLFYAYLLKAYWITLLYSFGVQILQVISAWMIIYALGTDENVFSYLLLFLISSIVAVLPVSIGGVGVRELTFMYGAGLMGINLDVAVGVSMMFWVITAIVSFFGIYYVVRPIK